MIGGMLSITMGAVLKAVSYKDFKNLTCFFTYSMWMGLFGIGSYVFSILNLVKFF